MSDTLPAWAMEQAREAVTAFEKAMGFRSAPMVAARLTEAIAHAIIDADKAATERAANIAETLIPNGKGKAQSVADAAGHHVAAAIRNQVKI